MSPDDERVQRDDLPHRPIRLQRGVITLLTAKRTDKQAKTVSCFQFSFVLPTERNHPHGPNPSRHGLLSCAGLHMQTKIAATCRRLYWSSTLMTHLAFHLRGPTQEASASCHFCLKSACPRLCSPLLFNLEMCKLLLLPHPVFST